MRETKAPEKTENESDIAISTQTTLHCKQMLPLTERVPQRDLVIVHPEIRISDFARQLFKLLTSIMMMTGLKYHYFTLILLFKS